MHGTEFLLLCGIGAAGFVCHWVAWRLKLPSILFLLTTGIVVGPILGWLNPEEMFGDLLAPLVSIAVAIILFEGSLTLRLEDLRGHGAVVRNLVTIGSIVTGVIATLSVIWVLNWDWEIAALFGAIVTVSGPTVVIPLLRTVRLSSPLASIVRWEGMLIDPLGAVLAVLIFYFIISTQTVEGFAAAAKAMATITMAGGSIGVGGGVLFTQLVRRRWLPDFLRDYAALAIVLLGFGLAETLAAESGLLAVTVLGIWLANQRGLKIQDILSFQETISLVLVAGLFIILAARLDVQNLLALGPGALIVLLILQFVGGPLRAALSTIGSSLNWRERTMLAWMFPRGIVAAAVSSLFALRLEQFDYPNADNLVPLVFCIILGTVIIQSLTAKPLANLLKVADPHPSGVLIIGSNPAALLYAQSLQDIERDVLIADDNWDGIRKARMLGLRTFYGSPVSIYAERHLELVGLGYLIAASQHPGLNELSCVRFADELGRNHVFTLVSETRSPEKFRIAGETLGRPLFAREESIESISELARQDPKRRWSTITDEFSYENFAAKYPTAVVLFVADPGGDLHFAAEDWQEIVGAGCSIASVNRPESA